MPALARDKTGRNDSCPCGSGRKYKHCCLKAAAAVDESPWAKQRRASDRLTRDMQAFAHRRFREDLIDMWCDFNQNPFERPLEEVETEGQIFFPYMLFDWDPGRPQRPRRGTRRRAGIVASTYLEKNGSELTELEELILQQSLSQPISFYEVVHCEPGLGLTLRDVLIGGETTVEEHTASRTLRRGDLAYAQICRLPEVSTLGRLAPTAIAPRYKAQIVALRSKLRRKIAKQNRELDAQDLVRYAEEIRCVYLDIRDATLRPPKIVNTDGEAVLFHTMTYRVGSANVAFEALHPLAWGVSRDDLLDSAEMNPDGTLHSVEIEWAKAGNEKFKTWDNTILGRIMISGRSLTAEANSSERAATLRHEIESRLGILAVHQRTRTQTPEEIVKDRKPGPSASGSRTVDPELEEWMAAEMQTLMESWADQEIPALGGRTPMEAVADPDGREIVEGLLLDWERQEERPAVPGLFRPDFRMLRRRLNLPLSED